MSNLTVRPINTGFVTMIPKQYLYHHSTVAFYPEASDQEEEYPVFTYLVEGGGKLLLVDTGMAYHRARRQVSSPWIPSAGGNVDCGAARSSGV